MRYSLEFLIKEKMVEDHVPPVITCSEDELVLSVNENQEEALMNELRLQGETGMGI